MGISLLLPAGVVLLGMIILFTCLGWRNPWVSLVLGILLLLPTGFSIFGFLASAELPSEEALPWRFGYGTLFFLCLGTSVGLIAKSVRILVRA